MLCQYFVISRGSLSVPDLFTANRDGLYYYQKGWNYRAYIAYVAGIAPNFYGFLGVFGLHITVAATRMYYFAYPMGLFISFCTYWALCHFDPPLCMMGDRKFKEPRNYVESIDDEPKYQNSELDPKLEVTVVDRSV
jgi:NCS1 family nucleobase:cation symporter-1